MSNIAAAGGRHTWSVVAALLMLAALVLLSLARAEAAVGAAALGVVAWFLNVRVQLEAGNVERDAARAEAEVSDENDGGYDTGNDES